MADTKQYWLNVAKEAGLSEDQTKALEAAVANDKFANAFVPRPEYSRSLDAETQKYRDLVAQNEQYYKTEAQRAAENQNKVNEALTQAQRYRDLYGELEPGATPRTAAAQPAFDASKYISKDDYDAALKRIEGQSLFVIKEGLKASQDYMTRFKKPLDIDALEKFAVEKGLPINQAYREFVAPEAEAQQNATFAEKLAQARAEGAADALSRANVPIDTRSREASPFLSNALKPVVKDAASMSESERANSFAEAWNNPAGTAKS
jgi:hypothetical protein